MTAFLSTPSARRATRSFSSLRSAQRDFYPRPPRGGRRQLRRHHRPIPRISIHALREEGDAFRPPFWLACPNFYPRPPRGGRPHRTCRATTAVLFLSTPSARRATGFCKVLYWSKEFLSTPSARRATVPASSSLIAYTYFYPRPPRGGRRKNLHAIVGIADFYPRPPRGGRPSQYNTSWNAMPFLSTPSARRATAKTETKSLFSNKLYNILHEFRRALIYSGSKNYPNHAKRLKNLVRRCRKDAENSPFAPGRETQNNSRPSCSKGG